MRNAGRIIGIVRAHPGVAFFSLCFTSAFDGESISWGSGQIVTIFTGIFTSLAIVFYAVW
jgi:hypothetical protein